MIPEKAVTIKVRKKIRAEAGIMDNASSLDFKKYLLRSTRKTTPMANSREEKMMLAVQIIERIPTHPSTPARWEMAFTSLKINPLAWGKRRSKKEVATRQASSEDP